MRTPRALSALACTLALLLALTGVTSAGMMAPDRAAAARAAMEIAHGMSPDELCGSHAGHAHNCPFCHGLPGAPALSCDGQSAPLTLQDGWRQSADRHRAAQARDAGHSPRAPPA